MRNLITFVSKFYYVSSLLFSSMQLIMFNTKFFSSSAAIGTMSSDFVEHCRLVVYLCEYVVAGHVACVSGYMHVR